MASSSVYSDSATSLTGTTSCVACILAYSPIIACQVIWVYTIFFAYEGHICCGHIFCSGMVNVVSYSSLMGICSNVVYVDYGRNAVGHICAMWQAHFFRGICQ